jgi:hypothetical protein
MLHLLKYFIFFHCLVNILTLSCNSFNLSYNESPISIQTPKYDLISPILLENGIEAETPNIVNDQLEFINVSTALNNPDYNAYYLIIPKNGQNALVLSDNINRLYNEDPLFRGIKTPASYYAYRDTIQPIDGFDTIIITTNTSLYINSLNAAGNNLRSLPSSIGNLKGHCFSFDYNMLTYVPEDAMKITKELKMPLNPLAIIFSIAYNNIDTLNVSDSLSRWLDVHSIRNSSDPKPPWWSTQRCYNPLPDAL